MTQYPRFPDLLPAAEFSLCLSRAFLAPTTGVTLAELRGPLLDDLRNLAETLPTLNTERLEALSQALAALTDTQQVMLGYSRLFLTPPAPAPLNLGAYLDGGLMSRSVPSMEALYHRHGLERDPAFRDLPDHLSLHLQWLAWVYSEAMEAREAATDASPAMTDAATMLHDFTLPAMAGVRRKVTQAAKYETTLPWRLLVELTHDQLTEDFARLKAALPSLALQQSRAPGQVKVTTGVESFEASEAPRETLTCRSCGEFFKSDPVMAEMRQRLTAACVSTDHLAICPRCQGRDAASHSLKPPGASLKAWQ
ncbi:molecular chaperone TorD family protein [Halomonas sp. ANAO-440]|uniref:TorD/DmsD family molecular chaperone n=1 Tax=Halomonas sp. ANAO-440 TaxID=2861360 RepID=UPI001CAA4B5F|nr:molecular chaperone TorD family protein [Halomonas sp. ANAO-440]MBZ0331610.1 molecular chaperone TorD family protein [Halomonas sp. ANAO-440]